MPIIAETHDPECTAGCADDPSLLDRLCSVINRATKATTGYFGGYTSKRQPVGKYGLSESARTLPLLAHKIQGDQAYTQLYRCTSRMAADNYGEGILRTMPEEFNLFANMSRTDATAPEFIRTFHQREFRGAQYLYAVSYTHLTLPTILLV